VPGTVIVLLDSCYSGTLIAKGASASDAGSFTDNAIAAFSGARSSGITAKAIVSGTKFHVIASSSQTQESFAMETYDSGEKHYGLATNALCEAMGWQHSGDSSSGNTLSALEGDINGDLIVTIGEAYACAAGVVTAQLNDYNKEVDKLEDRLYQNMQIYPAGSAQTLIAREPPSAASQVEISKATKSSMNLTKACIAPGITLQLDCGSDDAYWTSSKPSLATVNSATGVVTGVKYSYSAVTTIMATYIKNGQSYYASCEVRVLPSRYVVQKLRLKYSTLTLQQGSSYTMPTRFYPGSARYKGLKWKSSDESVATVSSSGRITAVSKDGKTAEITATATSGVIAKCTVTSIGALPKSIKLDKTKLTLIPGEDYMLTEVISPSIAEDKTVTWTSSRTSVATVNGDGQVVAHATGTAVITAKTNAGGKKAYCVVSVVKNQSIPRTRPKSSAGKVVSSARRIYYGTDGTLRVEMFFYNRTRYTQTVPEPSHGLVVFTRKGSAILTAEDTFSTKTVRSGHYLIYNFIFDVGEFPQLDKIDLRGMDAYFEPK
jgi:uncharacterized protein YjdB